jgi:KaiC/GvpD/RAD55 family RecA-like ATPase
MFTHLIKSTNFFRVVFPHLKQEYLIEKTDRIVLDKLRLYYEKYNRVPSFSDISIMVQTDATIDQDPTDAVIAQIKSYQKMEQVSDEKLLIDEVESFVQNRAMELAILSSVAILDDDGNRGVIREKIEEALAIQFIVEVGHDYFADAKERLASYFEVEEKIPLDIDKINEAMGGGLERKGLFIFAAPPNKGKTLWMCHSAASLLKTGQNVLYISSEMSEKAITKRIDANLLDIEMKELAVGLDKNKFKSKISELFKKTQGKLIVKQFPTGTCNSYHIKALLNEIKLKKGFIPDVVVLDYINIFSSSRLPASAATNSYLYVKSICEEMRALAVEFDLCMLSAVQNNRGSAKKTTDTGMEDMAESWGIAMTADWVGTIIQNDELRAMGKYLIKVIKTRFDENNDSVYTVGVIFKKMRLTNLEDDQQEIPEHIKDKLRSEKKKKGDAETYTMFDFTE